MKRTIAFCLNNFETMPASIKNRAMTLKEISLKIKDLQRRHGYPPDKQDGAGLVKIEQMCKDWV